MRFFDKIDWQALREQKDALLTIQGEITDRPEYDAFEGLVSLLDTLMDDAEKAGYPVVWSSECENCTKVVASDKLIDVADGSQWCTECWSEYCKAADEGKPDDFCEYCQESGAEELIECRNEMGEVLKVCEVCWDSLYDRGLAVRV